MSDASSDVADSIEALIEANRVVRTQLKANERLLRRALLVLGDGTAIARTMEMIPSTDARSAAELAMQGLTEARMRVRRAVVRAGIAEGMTVAEISAAFGIPPEQVRTYSDDARGGR